MTNKPKNPLEEKPTLNDLVNMQTEVALFKSMAESKSLIVMVLILLGLFTGLLLFLFH